MDFQKIKIYFFYKIILIEACFIVLLKFINSGIQPDRFSKVKLIDNFIQGMEYFVCPGIIAVVADDSVF